MRAAPAVHPARPAAETGDVMPEQLKARIGTKLASYLSRPSKRYVTFSVTPTPALRACLSPCDVLLVEGDQRISSAIKYLTQSTWSHAALYVGDSLPAPAGGSEAGSLIEADLETGVVSVPLSRYQGLNTRICRPTGLTEIDRRAVGDFMVQRIGLRYDLKHVFDLLRYLLPTPPVPVRWRRSMLSLGSGDPTRAICSTLIAQAFQSVQYPILPKIRLRQFEGEETARELYQMRHHGLFTPRDFDLSPYFEVIKPTLKIGFNYKQLEWYETASDVDLECAKPKIDGPAGVSRCLPDGSNPKVTGEGADGLAKSPPQTGALSRLLRSLAGFGDRRTRPG